MRIKRDNNLELLINSVRPVDRRYLESSLLNELIYQEIIEGEEEDYGYSIMDNIDRDIDMKEIKDILRKVGVQQIDQKHIDALLNLVVMGDGDCPMCGGDCEVELLNDKIVGGDGYEVPEDHECECEYRCKVCGHTFTE